jgi:hypothetical protein
MAKAMGSCSYSTRSTFEPINGLRVLGFQTTWLFSLFIALIFAPNQTYFPTAACVDIISYWAHFARQ